MRSAEEFLKFIKENELKEDSTFNFKCDTCGKCCCNRNDIILSPYDIFRIAKYLKIETIDVVTKYCDVYIGRNSKIPICSVNFLGKRRECVFKKGRYCSIQEVKPTVCALYPLGRAYNIEEKRFVYFRENTACGQSNNPILTKDWLENFKLKDSERYTILQSELVLKIHKYLENKEIPEEDFDRLEEMVYNLLYNGYDTDKDFYKQFEKRLHFFFFLIHYRNYNKT